MWQCKDCKITVSTRSQLLKHYRLAHGHYGRGNRFPCTYSECPCRFKTWNALHSHLNRNHEKENSGLPAIVTLATFNCHVCSCSNIESEREYFSHIHNHLKNSETVSCMFEHCSFQTNVYGTFKYHKNRKHSSYSLQDFKPGVVGESGTQELIEDPLPAEEEDVDVSGSVEMVTEGQDLSKTIELKFASIFCIQFSRITTVPLIPTFMSKLDGYTSKLASIYRKKGGVAGRKIWKLMATIDENDTISTRRACILRALSVYLNEDYENLMKEYADTDFENSERDMANTVIGIYIIRPEDAEACDPPSDVGLIVEGVKVLQNLGDVTKACALLLGVIYSLNLSYPSDLKYTFEFFQKVLLGLDGQKLSQKIQVLKNKLVG